MATVCSAEAIPRQPLAELSQAPGAASGRRLLFLDWFRGFWVLVMMDAHVTNALVRPASGRFFEYHTLLFNLAAPGFLFASGISFGMSAASRWEDYRWWSGPLQRRLKRIAEILIFAYLLHLPFFSLRRTFSHATHAQLMDFVKMDVLQCIGASALVLLAIVWLAPKSSWFPATCLTLACAVPLATPPVWNRAQHLPWWAATVVSRATGSFFPLLPYAGFAFAGAAWGYYYSASQRRGGSRFLNRTGWAGWILLCLSILIVLLPLPEPYSDFWNANPVFFLMRVGVMLLVLTAGSMIERLPVPGTRSLVLLGQESLLAYLAHLVIVYGWVTNPSFNLSKLLSGGINIPESFIVLALLTGAMTLLAYGWSRCKQLFGSKVRPWGWGVGVVLFAVFVLG